MRTLLIAVALMFVAGGCKKDNPPAGSGPAPAAAPQAAPAAAPAPAAAAPAPAAVAPAPAAAAPAPAADAPAPAAAAPAPAPAPAANPQNPFAALAQLGKAMAGGGAAPDQPAGNPQNPFAALQQLGKALTGGGGGTVVNWRTLQQFVPDSIGDFKAQGDVNGSTGGLGGLQTSQVRRNYQQGERRLHVEIVDTTAAAMMRTPFAFALNLNEDSSSGIRKGIKVGAYPGILEWRKSDNHSEVTALVADRFIVKARVTPSQNPEEAVGIVTGLNLAGLAGAK